VPLPFLSSTHRALFFLFYSPCPQIHHTRSLHLQKETRRTQINYLCRAASVRRRSANHLGNLPRRCLQASSFLPYPMRRHLHRSPARPMPVAYSPRCPSFAPLDRHTTPGLTLRLRDMVTSHSSGSMQTSGPTQQTAASKIMISSKC